MIKFENTETDKRIEGLLYSELITPFKKGNNMIEIETSGIDGFEQALYLIRDSDNSIGRSDSFFGSRVPHINFESVDLFFEIGMKDLAFMKKLVEEGEVSREFLKKIIVYADITAPIYWWEDFDRYNAIVKSNFYPLNLKILEKEFTMEDFSSELVINWSNESQYHKCDVCEDDSTSYESGFIYQFLPIDCLSLNVRMLNKARKLYLDTGDDKYWWQIIKLLPFSYNKKKRVLVSYHTLIEVINSYEEELIDEWRYFRDWALSLPYMKEFVA